MPKAQIRVYTKTLNLTFCHICLGMIFDQKPEVDLRKSVMLLQVGTHSGHHS